MAEQQLSRKDEITGQKPQETSGQHASLLPDCLCQGRGNVPFGGSNARSENTVAENSSDNGLRQTLATLLQRTSDRFISLSSAKINYR